MPTPITPGRYRHFKGREYVVLGTARHSETQEELVVYRQEYGDHALWVRPLAMFAETVEHDGRQVPRFERTGDQATQTHASRWRRSAFVFAALVAIASIVVAIWFVKLDRELADTKWNYTELKLEGFANVMRGLHEKGVDISSLKSLDEMFDAAQVTLESSDFLGDRKHWRVDDWGRPLLWTSSKFDGMSIVIVSSQGRLRATSSVSNSPILRAVVKPDGELVTEILQTWRREDVR